MRPMLRGAVLAAIAFNATLAVACDDRYEVGKSYKLTTLMGVWACPTIASLKLMSSANRLSQIEGDR